MPRFDRTRLFVAATLRAGRGLAGMAAVAMLSLQTATVTEPAASPGASAKTSAESAVVTTIALPAPAILALEEDVLRLVNQHRSVGARCGATWYPAVAPLVMNGNLRTAARLHSEDMAAANYFSHTSRDGRTFSQRIRDAGYTGWTSIGENIGAGYGSPQLVVAGWMTSPGHCANIMSRRFGVVGIGYAFRAGLSSAGYWTQDFGGR